MASLPDLFPGFSERRFKTDGAEIYAPLHTIATHSQSPR